MIDIDELSGELRFVSELDYESHPAVRTLVTASDEVFTHEHRDLFARRQRRERSQACVSAPNCRNGASVCDDTAAH